MITGAITLGIIYALYLLLVRGLLWKLILLVMGWEAIRLLLPVYLPSSQATAITFQEHTMSWATAVATVVVVMALLTTKEE